VPVDVTASGQNVVAPKNWGKNLTQFQAEPKIVTQENDHFFWTKTGFQ
jgi:hypothetical protein